MAKKEASKEPESEELKTWRYEQKHPRKEPESDELKQWRLEQKQKGGKKKAASAQSPMNKPPAKGAKSTTRKRVSGK